MIEHFKKVLIHARPLAREYLLGLAALLLSSLFQLATPQVLRRVVDDLRTNPAEAPVAQMALIFIALSALQAVFRFFSRRKFLGNARSMERDLRRDYLRHLLVLPVHRIEQAKKGDLISRATHDIQDVRLFLGAGVLNFFQTAILLVFTVIFLWRIHPLLTLAALSPFPVITWLVGKYSPRLHAAFGLANKREGELSSLVQEALSSFRVLRSFDRTGWQAEKFGAANDALCEAQIKTVRTWAFLFPLVGFCAGLGHVVVLGFGGFLVSSGAITLGGFVAFHTYLALLIWPMVALGWTMSLLARGRAAMGRINEIMDWEPVDVGASLVAPFNEGDGFELTEVSFTYPGARRRVLEGVSLSIGEPGFYGLVGATGSGKSTLLSLIGKLRGDGGGSLRFRGENLRALSPASYSDTVAIVEQGGFFFGDTIAANVVMGKTHDDKKLWEALETAGLADEARSFGDGAETIVGEGGVTLSGGQRQRLSIARALYGKPEVLILDAALSNLDAETANRVILKIRSSRPDLTLLVVSHRGAEMEGADEVFFLEDGRISASGPHEELLRESPGYLRLYREEKFRKELEEFIG